MSVPPWCHVISIGLSGRSHDQKDSNFKICNIVIPWPMEVLRSKIKRGIIKRDIEYFVCARSLWVEIPLIG